jgi:hypothetical protein
VRRATAFGIFAFLVFPHQTAWAASDTEIVAREAARAAALAAAREAAQSWGNAQAAGASIGAGTAVLGSIDLALAVNDFARARSDKQRFYAGLRAGAAVYVLASGPAAPVVALAVTAAVIVEAGFAARHAKALLEIYKEIEEAERRHVEIRKKLAAGDAIAFDTILSELQRSLAVTAEAEAGLKNQCTDAAAIGTLDDLNQCVFWFTSYNAHAENFISAANALLSWRSELIPADVVFDAAKVKRADIVSARDGFAMALQRTREVQIQLMASYSELASNIIRTQALDSPVFSTREYLAYNCIDATSALARSSNELLLLSLPQTSAGPQLDRQALSVRASSLLRAIDQLEQAACKDFAAAGDSSEQLLLRSWRTHLGQSRVLVSRLAIPGG